MKICELILKSYGKFSGRHIELGDGCLEWNADVDVQP